MLASLKVVSCLLLVALLGVAGGYRLQAAVPEPPERVVVVTASPVHALPATADAVGDGERSVASAAAMSSGMVSGGELVQPLPAY
jgi:hypothetical protein